MSDKKGRGTRKSDRPVTAAASALKEKRDAFLHTFFKRGAELTDEIVHDNHRLREQIAKLEDENAALRRQVASDRAMRDLLRKIDELEQEKKRLLSTVEEKEEITGQISNRFAEVESELEAFANLYVASFQLHLSPSVALVLRHVKELLGQLVGARSSAIYFLDVEHRRLEAIASDGIELSQVPPVSLQNGAPSDVVEAAVERALLTGVSSISPIDSPPPPAACVPLMLGDRAVGVVVVFQLLEQKRRFLTVDRELFKLLGAHAAVALSGAFHFGKSGERIPTPAELRAITG
jgi:GAF domain-containing protein